MEILDDLTIVDDDSRSYNSVINDDYEFHFGDWISQAFTLLHANVGWYILITFIILAASFVIGLIPYGGSFLGGILTTILTYGIYTYAAKSEIGDPDFEDFFEPFRLPGPLLLLILITTLVSYLGFIPLATYMGFGVITQIDYNDPVALQSFLEDQVFEDIGAFIGLILLGVLLSIAIITFFMLSPLFILIGKLPLGKAISASFKVVSKHFFHSFLLLLVVSFLSGMGIIVCGVGVLYTFPIASLGIFSFYKSAVGLAPIYQD